MEQPSSSNWLQKNYLFLLAVVVLVFIVPVFSFVMSMVIARLVVQFRFDTSMLDPGAIGYLVGQATFPIWVFTCPIVFLLACVLALIILKK